MLHHILLLVAYTFRENRGFVFITSVQFMMSVKSRIHFGLQIVFAYWYITPSHYHHCANLSEGIENSCQIFLSSVWVRLSTFFSLIHCTIYGVVCLQFTYFPCDDWENMHLYECMNYYPLFRVRSWNNGMRCMSLYILISYRTFITFWLCIYPKWFFRWTENVLTLSLSCRVDICVTGLLDLQNDGMCVSGYCVQCLATLVFKIFTLPCLPAHAMKHGESTFPSNIVRTTN